MLSKHVRITKIVFLFNIYLYVHMTIDLLISMHFLIFFYKLESIIHQNNRILKLKIIVITIYKDKVISQNLSLLMTSSINGAKIKNYRQKDNCDIRRYIRGTIWSPLPPTFEIPIGKYCFR